MREIYIYVSIVLLFLMSPFLDSQSISRIGSPLIRSYTAEEYGGDPQSWAAVQDLRGVMYFGNEWGILEYDGVGWSTIPLPHRGRVRSLGISTSGVIYVGGLGEMGFLEADDSGQLGYRSLMELIPKGHRSFSDIWSIHPTGHGVYFVSYHKIFRLFQNRIQVIEAKTKLFGSHIKDWVFISLREKGMHLLKDGKLTPLPNCEMVADPSCFWTFTLPYSQREVVFVTGKGLFLYDFPDFKLTSAPRKLPTEIDGFIQKYRLYSCTAIPMGAGLYQYALGSISGGMLVIDHQGKLISIINKNRGLPSNLVFHLMVDRQRNVWAGLSKGIAYVELSSPITQFSEKQGLAESVHDLLRFKGRIYAGTYNGIFYLPDHQLNLENDQHRFMNVANTQYLCYELYTDGNILLGGGIDQLFQIKGEKARLLTKQFYPLSICSSPKFPHHLFIGTFNGFEAVRIRHTPSNSLELQRETIPQFKAIKQEIYKVEADVEGNLWLGSETKGLFYIHFKEDNLASAKIHSITTANGLPSDRGNSVFTYAGKIYLSTSKGIFKPSMEEGETIRVVPDNSFGTFFNSSQIGVNEVVLQNPDRIWVLSNQGLGILQKGASGKFDWYDTPFRRIRSKIAGFQVEESGQGWIFTEGGLYLYDPSIDKDYQSKFQTLIRRVTVKGERDLYLGTPATHRSHKIKSLPYHQNTILFHYAAAFFESPESTLYSYQLKGFDEKWSPWTSETRKEYTNLPERSYRFQVKGQNCFGQVSDIAGYEFKVLPPWSRTPLAYALYFFVFMLVLITSIRLNSRRLRAVNLKLERLVKERTAVIEEQKEHVKSINEELKDFAHIVSHDLKAPLRGIDQVSRFIEDDLGAKLDDEDKEYLDLLRSRVTKMQNLIDGILQYSRAGTAGIKIQKVDLDELLREFIDAIALPDHIHLTIETHLPTIETDATRIQQLFQNLISNAIKYIDKSQGDIRIGHCEEDKHWQFYVSDNGPGIDQKYQEKIFQMFQTLYKIDDTQSTGVGLSVVKKIVEQFGGKIWVESQLGEGSTFFFTLKK